ncbi:MAG TPA: DinB family protein [Chryseosolibacter sp.]
MNISKACVQILDQLADVVHQLTASDFAKASPALSNSTVGQHLRHTLEFFICFEEGYNKGVVNYDKRAHDKLIETDKSFALATIKRIAEFIQGVGENRSLKLEVSYDLHKNDFVIIETNTTRELVYNVEHAVHHMAIMKIGIREIAPYVTLPSNFGVAASTVRYKESVGSER